VAAAASAATWTPVPARSKPDPAPVGKPARPRTGWVPVRSPDWTPDPPPPAADKPPVEVPLRRKEDGLFAEVKVNGKPAGRFLLDTGSLTNVVHTAVANRLDLPALPVAGAVVGSAGSAPGTVRSVQSLQVGPLSMSGHDVMAVDLSPTRSVFGFQAGGILGTPLFSRYPVTFDYTRARLTVHEGGAFTPPPGLQPLPLEVVRNRPYVKVSIDGRYEGRALVDTGTTGDLVFEAAFVKNHPDLVPRDARRTGVVGLAGSRPRLVAPVNSVEVFGRTLRQVAAVFPGEEGAQGPGDGRIATLGGGVLSRFRVTLDYARRQVWVEDLPRSPRR
jgi:hypothetical protein